MNSEYKYRYRIHVKPAGYYFFGGEQTFGEDKEQNYFAKTRPYPQQTSLLGLLRHIGHEHKLDIGNSFDPEVKESGEPNAFGYIRKLSPLFFAEENKGQTRYYLPAFRAGLNKNGQAELFPLTPSKGKAYAFGQKDSMTAYVFKGYSPKKPLEDYLIAPGNEKKQIRKLSGLIKTFVKTGINKPRDGSVPEDGFFKQQVAMLPPNWSFCLLADLDEHEAEKLPRQIAMPFGADKCLFSVRMEKLEHPVQFSDLFPPGLWEHTFPQELCCLLLTSDAVLDEKTLTDHTDFACTETVNFRSIYTPKDSINMNDLWLRSEKNSLDDDKNPPKMSKSSRYMLLKRGSMLYASEEKMEMLKKKLDKWSNYRKIGYNHYLMIAPQPNANPN